MSETWVYRQRVTLYEPINSYYYYGPGHGFGDDEAGRGFLPAYADGGTGYEGTLRNQPHVRSLDLVRIVEFSGGEVDRYKAADGTWKSAPPRIVASGRDPRAALTVKHTDRKLPQIIRPSDRTASVSHQTFAHQTGGGDYHHPSLSLCHTPHSPPS